MNKDREVHTNSLQNTAGKHIMLSYYGYQHLLINLYHYMGAGIENNEIIYCIMFPGLYQRLIQDLKKYNLQTRNIFYCPLEKILKRLENKNYSGLKLMQNTFKTEALNEGYSGIRFIEHPSYVIQNSSTSFFLNIEKNLSRSIKNTLASILCLYDFYDYINHKKIIDYTIIYEAYKTHNYRLIEFNLKRNI